MMAYDDQFPRILPFKKISIGICLFSLIGCGETQISPDNRELILKLATATSNQDSNAIEKINGEILSLFKTGSINNKELKVLTSIIELSQSNDWQRARTRAYELRDGQEPTAEDLQRINQRVLPKMIKTKSNRSLSQK